MESDIGRLGEIGATTLHARSLLRSYISMVERYLLLEHLMPRKSEPWTTLKVLSLPVEYHLPFVSTSAGWYTEAHHPSQQARSVLSPHGSLDAMKKSQKGKCLTSCLCSPRRCSFNIPRVDCVDSSHCVLGRELSGDLWDLSDVCIRRILHE